MLTTIAIGGVWGLYDNYQHDPLSQGIIDKIFIIAQIIVIGLIALLFSAFSAVWVAGTLYVLVMLPWRWITCKKRDPAEGLRTARIVPYFEQSLNLGWKDSAVSSGLALAHHCEQLDLIAEEANVKPLTDFGLEDDLLTTPAQWRNADDGLRTVDALLQANRGGNAGDQEELESDLLRLHEALEHAKASKCGFLLVIRFTEDARVSPHIPSNFPRGFLQ